MTGSRGMCGTVEQSIGADIVGCQGQDHTNVEQVLRRHRLGDDAPDDLLSLGVVHVFELPRHHQSAVESCVAHALRFHGGVDLPFTQSALEDISKLLAELRRHRDYLSHNGFSRTLSKML